MLTRITQIITYTFRRYWKEGFAYRASALAYTSLLSIVPLAIISLGVLSIFPIFSGVGEKLQHWILENFVANSVPTISQYLTNFARHVRLLSMTNIAFLVVVAVSMMSTISQTFNAIWQVKRGFNNGLSLLIYLLVVLLSPLCLGGAMVLGSVFIKLPLISTFIGLSVVHQPLFLLLPFVLTFLTFTVFNGMLPACRVKLRYAAIGGLVSTVLFEMAKYIFAFYLVHFETDELLYGALATIPIFLLWLYCSWTIILIGGLVSKAASEKM